MEVSSDRLLKGKANFVTWKREFERAAKAQDVLDLLTGDEDILSKPKPESYLITVPRSSARAAAKQLATPSADNENTDTEITQSANAANNTLRWQMDYEAWKTNKDNLRIASKLLNEWVCEGIKFEIEDCENAKVAYDLIKERYKVSPERARDLLLSQLNGTKLEDFTSVTEYLNKLRQLRVDLKASDYVMTDDMFTSILLHGLPPNYRNFKEQYDWVRSAKPDDPPDLDYLFDRLQIEEIKQTRIKEEKKAKERIKKENGNNRGTGSDTNKSKDQDKSHLKCDACGKAGHVEDNCWTTHPELMRFSSFHPLDVNVNTADGSTSLKIQGGGTVDLDLLQFTSEKTRLSLSEVAYAPNGRCNLLSLGIFSQKARISGKFDDEKITADSHEVGRARQSNGFYHLDAIRVAQKQGETTISVPKAPKDTIVAAIDFDDPVWMETDDDGDLSPKSPQVRSKYFANAAIKAQKGGNDPDMEDIPKENRDKPKRKLLEVKPEEQPCRRCYQRRRKCRRTKGPAHFCDGCLREKRNCNSDIAGANQASKGTRSGGIKGLKGVPFEKKCYRCSKRNLSCDGKTPCSTCGSRYQCVSQEHKKATRDHPKCLFCQREGFACDKKRPCSTCIRKGRNCGYGDQEGFVKRMYLDDGVWLTESEEECTTCKSSNLLDSAGPPQTNNADAQSAFDAAFPNGRYEVIPTQSTGLECGFYAIINSMRAQYPELPQPTLQDLREVFHSPEFTEHAAAFGLDNTNNFTADQVGAVTHFWADTYHDLNIQLGYLSEGRGPDLVPTPGSDQNERIVLWIHNDNAQDGAEQEGLNAEGVMNHYSGLRSPSTRAQKKNISSKKRPRKQLSDTDSESSGNDEIAKRRAKVDNDVGLFQAVGLGGMISAREKVVCCDSIYTADIHVRADWRTVRKKQCRREE